MQPLEETLIRLRMSVSGLRDASYIASTYVEAIRGSGCDLPSDSINRAWLGLMLLGMIGVLFGGRMGALSSCIGRVLEVVKPSKIRAFSCLP